MTVNRGDFKGEDVLYVDTPVWDVDGPQVWHDSWRHADRVLRFKGLCYTCERRTYAFDDGENDPRGILGDNAADPMHAEDYDCTGPDVPQCFLCSNEQNTYTAALDHGRRHLWAPRSEFDRDTAAPSSENPT